MSKESSQPPAWGSPAEGLKWGSPLVTPDTNMSNSLNPSPGTPMIPRGQESSFSPRHGNRFNRPHNPSPSLRKQFSTPPNFSPRPLFHSSPMNMSPRQRFSQNRDSQGRGSPSNRGSPFSNQKSHSFQRSFSGDDSMSNPGASGNIEDYIHPSMLQDPWRDLPPTPMKKLS